MGSIWQTSQYVLFSPFWKSPVYFHAHRSSVPKTINKKEACLMHSMHCSVHTCTPGCRLETPGRDLTSSACRWAWPPRWGTGGTRWHRPDTEPLVLLRRCYLRRGGLVSTCSTSGLTSCERTDAAFAFSAFWTQWCISRVAAIELQGRDSLSVIEATEDGLSKEKRKSLGWKQLRMHFLVCLCNLKCGIPYGCKQCIYLIYLCWLTLLID